MSSRLKTRKRQLQNEENDANDASEESPPPPPTEEMRGKIGAIFFAPKSLSLVAFDSQTCQFSIVSETLLRQNSFAAIFEKLESLVANFACLIFNANQSECAQIALAQWPDAKCVYCKSGHFNAPHGKEKLRKLLACSPLYLSSRVDLDDGATLRCFDALIFVLASRFGLALSGDDAAPVSIERLDVGRVLRVDRGTLKALGVVPPVDKSLDDASKVRCLQDLLMQHTVSAAGGRLMRRWVQAPLQCLQTILARQECVAFFAAPVNRPLAAQLSTQLGAVKSVASLARKLSSKSRSASLADWKNVLTSARRLDELVRTLRDSPAGELVARVCGAALCAALSVDALAQVAKNVARVVDFDASSEQARVVVCAGVSADLDELRHFYDGMGDFFNRVGAEEMVALAPVLPSVTALSIAYYPQIGCQLVIAKSEVEHLDDALQQHAPQTPASGERAAAAAAADDDDDEDARFGALAQLGLQFQFESDLNVYFKNKRMLELDEFLGDIHSDIVDMEAGLLRELERAVTTQASALLAALDFGATLDCLLAMAALAVANNYCRPALTLDVEHNSLYILDGRHALHENRSLSDGGGAFVPNNCALDSKTNVLLLSGPNFSGKSTYIKQVALIVLLAQLGSFVPASACQLSLVDRIYTRVQSCDSLAAATSLSSFADDCRQVSGMLERATRQSLLLIDEFGKGTHSHDGVALMTALLQHLSKDGAPKALLITHFNQLYKMPLLQARLENRSIQFCRMNFVWSSQELSDASRHLVPLYKLVPSSLTTAADSFGVECARRAGMPHAIVQRAAAIIQESLAHNAPIEPLESGAQADDKRQQQRQKALQLFEALRNNANRNKIETTTEFINQLKAIE